MCFCNLFRKNKKKSTLKIVLIVIGAVLAVATALFVAYKIWGHKLFKAKKRVIGEIDLDGDGAADAVMLDTTGNGEVDTIVIQADHDFEI